MLCPECSGKLQVLDTVKNPEENEIYRLKKCSKCGYSLFTVEYEVEVNKRFKIDWTRNYRKSNKTNI